MIEMALNQKKEKGEGEQVKDEKSKNKNILFEQ